MAGEEEDELYGFGFYNEEKKRLTVFGKVATALLCASVGMTAG